ncbi:MAG: class I SAM-dependent methyltransferase [Chloroflexota bacterium]
MSDQSTLDIWAKWLLESRFGGDDERMKMVYNDFLYPIRDKVLELSRLKEGETLLDVGTGDGLIAFGALNLAPNVEVVFSDISQDMLDVCHSLVEQSGDIKRTRFLNASADDLSALSEGSVDVVTTRSVLIYVKEKQTAFDEFYRVLKPGGRVALFEPINSYYYPPPPNCWMGYDIMPVQEPISKVKAYFDGLQPAADPMLDFGERDLIELAERANFETIGLELQIESKPIKMSWEDHLRRMRTPGNPKIPSLAEAMDEILSQTEIDAINAHFKEKVEEGSGRHRFAMAYMWARKPE